ncbi:DUF2931 family protein [Flavobacterium sp. 3-218]
MDNYKTEKFEWDGDATAPEGYPMWIIYPHAFISSNGYEAVIPNGTIMQDGWGGSLRSWSVGESNKPMPDSLKIAWYSYTENKFYKGNFKMPQEKLYNLFKEGYLIYGINWEKANKNDDYTKELHKETYSAITVGLAPKGMVVVWATGQNKIEIGRFQGEAVPEGPEADRMWQDITDLNLRSLVVKKRLEGYTPEVREEVMQGRISSKRWDDYRIRYKWKVAFNQNLEIYDYYVRFFNSEKIGLPPTTDQALYNKNVLESRPKAVPNELGIFVKGQDVIKHWLRIDSFDEQEVIKAFMDLAKINPDGEITMLINVDEAFTKMKVVLKNDFKEIELEKCKTKLFLIDKRAEEILKEY